MSICAWIDFPVLTNAAGDLTVIEGARQIPFEIARVYYLYNVPVSAVRGGHAHHALEQVLIAISGSFRVAVEDGRAREEHVLRDPARGLHLPRMVWREIDGFSQGAVCLVLASARYDPEDYIRDYDRFRALAAGEGA